MAKKFTALIMALVMMSLLPMSAFAAEKTSADQIVKNGNKQYYLASGKTADASNFDVWTSKTIAGTENEDEFEITLQVGTTMKAVPNDVAVVLVMDVSGSMMNDEDGNRWYENNMPEGKRSRIDYTREAAMEFAEAYVKNAGGSQRMLSVVQFGNTAQTLLPWTDANDNGVLSKSAKSALDSLEVNFTIDANKKYWDEERALKDFGQVDYWDATKADAVMQDYFKDFFQTYCQKAAMQDNFRSYLEATEEGSEGEASVVTCSYSGCTNSAEGHTHCAYTNCTMTEEHKHCGEANCALTVDHYHCSKCKEVTEHTHCSYEACTSTEAGHKHCGYEACNVKETHTHCVKCGLTTSEHTHIVGCTLANCPKPNEGPHTHCCTHSWDCLIPYFIKYNRWSQSYGYRCLNPDPTHTHEFTDSDVGYLTGSRYFGSVWVVGTNMEGGLLLARNLVSTGLAEGGDIEGIDNVYVVLLSDGNPTWRTNETSSTEVNFIGKADNDGTWAAVKDIVADGGEGDVAIAEDIKAMAELYAILYSNDLEGKLDCGSGHPLTGVSGADWIKGTRDYYVGADLVIDSPDVDGIEKAFLSLNDRIDILAKAWTVSDELSDDVTFLDFTENGAYAAFTPASDSENAAVTWALGNMTPESGDGSMSNPYLYTLKYKVKLNSAQENVKETSLAHDANSALDGVWTGRNAQLNYFMVEETVLDSMTPEEIKAQLRTAGFDNTSVKGIYGNLSFVKKNSETGKAMPGVGFTLYDSANKAYGSEVFSDDAGQVVFTNIPRGEYTLKETTAPEGMKEMSMLSLKESWGGVTQSDGAAVPAEILNYPVGTENPDNGDNGNNGNNGNNGTVKPPSTGGGVVDIPLAPIPEAFTADHYAYIIGYPKDYETGERTKDQTRMPVEPQGNITRAEVATIFFRLLDDQVRELNMVSDNDFSDVNKGQWFNNAISTMASMGIVNGYPDGTFRPNGKITRAEFAAIAARFNASASTDGDYFTDIAGHWGEDEIYKATNSGWIKGYEDNTFKPNQLITRAEAMTLVNRVLHRLPETTDDLHDDMLKWVDNMDTNKWYYLAVQEATNSHDYTRDPSNIDYETWTEMREARDWSELEY